MTIDQTSPAKESFCEPRHGYVFQMHERVAWILGRKEGSERTDAGRFLEEFAAEEILYGGFLWADLKLDSLLSRFHSRLLLDLQSGWSAVGFASRGTALGAWTAPTSARPHAAAPFGLYLLSSDRLRKSVSGSAAHLAETVHGKQPELGPVFCDPKLEVQIEGPRDFRYQPPSKRTQLVSALRYLFSGDKL